MTEYQDLVDAAYAALYYEAAKGLPALLSLGQWAFESGWGAHSPGNNCFGIKVYTGCSGKQLLATVEWFTDKEYARYMGGTSGRVAVRDAATPTRPSGRAKYLCKDWFASFNSLTDCFVKHARLITEGERYKKAWAAYQGSKDISQLVNDIAPIYATDPQYAVTLAKLVASKKITDVLAELLKTWKPAQPTKAA